MTEEEKEQKKAKDQAVAKKNEGNKEYKAKNFEKALQFYDEAIALDSNELTYYTNKAAVYFEMKDYQKCIECCDSAIAKSREGYYDYVKLGKALSRKGNAYLQMGSFDEAIQYFKDSLLENND